MRPIPSGEKHWSEVKKLLEEDRWREWYVADELHRDPAGGGIGHKENGTHPVTVRQVCLGEVRPPQNDGFNMNL